VTHLAHQPDTSLRLVEATDHIGCLHHQHTELRLSVQLESLLSALFHDCLAGVELPRCSMVVRKETTPSRATAHNFEFSSECLWSSGWDGFRICGYLDNSNFPKEAGWEEQ
jgi:hypothetical protein